MPICPNCEYEYVEGVTECPDCGYMLVDKHEFEEHLVNPEDWAEVYRTNEEYEAEMLKANLEGAGIETLIHAKKDRSFPAIGDLAVIKILVRKVDVEESRKIIEDINSSSAEEGEEI